MAPPAINRCRVLELGCAGGGNIIPMAYGLPESEFVGIDLSSLQIAEGQSLVQALGLSNITLSQGDILAVDADFGQFDYIIAHGIYSWVPSPVRDKVLAICRQNLASNGVAYISYNTYPGWKRFQMVRSIMQYHTRHLDDPYQRLAEARKLVNFLANSIPADDIHGDFIRAYNEHRLQEPPNAHRGAEAFILHDDLGEINDPFYFYQFVEQAARHGLQYLTEVEFSTTVPHNLPVSLAQALEQMSSNRTDFEQYLDFLANRMFRRTLLCHQEISLEPVPNPESLKSFQLASLTKSASLNSGAQPELKAGVPESFHISDNLIFTTEQPVTKAAFLCLAEIWPRTVSFDELLATSRSFLSANALESLADEACDAERLATDLLRVYGLNSKFLELYTQPPEFALDVSSRPRASELARLQVQRAFPVLTNLRHEEVQPTELHRYVLQSLDGKRDFRELTNALLSLVAEGKMSLVAQDGEPVEDTEQISRVLGKRVKRILDELARLALLTA